MLLSIDPAWHYVRTYQGKGVGQAYIPIRNYLRSSNSRPSHRNVYVVR